jgi:hypothetical protein
MFHTPAPVGFESIFGEDAAKSGGQRLFGAATRVSYVCYNGSLPDDIGTSPRLAVRLSLLSSSKQVNALSGILDRATLPRNIFCQTLVLFPEQFSDLTR